MSDNLSKRSRTSSREMEEETSLFKDPSWNNLSHSPQVSVNPREMEEDRAETATGFIFKGFDEYIDPETSFFPPSESKTIRSAVPKIQNFQLDNPIVSSSYGKQTHVLVSNHAIKQIRNARPECNAGWHTLKTLKDGKIDQYLESQVKTEFENDPVSRLVIPTRLNSCSAIFPLKTPISIIRAIFRVKNGITCTNPSSGSDFDIESIRYIVLLSAANNQLIQDYHAETSSLKYIPLPALRGPMGGDMEMTAFFYAFQEYAKRVLDIEAIALPTQVNVGIKEHEEQGATKKGKHVPYMRYPMWQVITRQGTANRLREALGLDQRFAVHQNYYSQTPPKTISVGPALKFEVCEQLSSIFDYVTPNPQLLSHTCYGTNVVMVAGIRERELKRIPNLMNLFLYKANMDRQYVASVFVEETIQLIEESYYSLYIKTTKILDPSTLAIQQELRAGIRLVYTNLTPGESDLGYLIKLSRGEQISPAVIQPQFQSPSQALSVDNKRPSAASSSSSSPSSSFQLTEVSTPASSVTVFTEEARMSNIERQLREVTSQQQAMAAQQVFMAEQQASTNAAIALLAAQLVQNNAQIARMNDQAERTSQFFDRFFALTDADVTDRRESAKQVTRRIRDSDASRRDRIHTTETEQDDIAHSKDLLVSEEPNDDLVILCRNPQEGRDRPCTTDSNATTGGCVVNSEREQRTATSAGQGWALTSDLIQQMQMVTSDGEPNDLDAMNPQTQTMFRQNTGVNHTDTMMDIATGEEPEVEGRAVRASSRTLKVIHKICPDDEDITLTQPETDQDLTLHVATDLQFIHVDNELVTLGRGLIGVSGSTRIIPRNHFLGRYPGPIISSQEKTDLEVKGGNSAFLMIHPDGGFVNGDPELNPGAVVNFINHFNGLVTPQGTAIAQNCRFQKYLVTDHDSAVGVFTTTSLTVREGEPFHLAIDYSGGNGWTECASFFPDYETAMKHLFSRNPFPDPRYMEIRAGGRPPAGTTVHHEDRENARLISLLTGLNAGLGNIRLEIASILIPWRRFKSISSSERLRNITCRVSRVTPRVTLTDNSQGTALMCLLQSLHSTGHLAGRLRTTSWTRDATKFFGDEKEAYSLSLSKYFPPKTVSSISRRMENMTEWINNGNWEGSVDDNNRILLTFRGHRSIWVRTGNNQITLLRKAHAPSMGNFPVSEIPTILSNPMIYDNGEGSYQVLPTLANILSIYTDALGPPLSELITQFDE